MCVFFFRKMEKIAEIPKDVILASRHKKQEERKHQREKLQTKMEELSNCIIQDIVEDIIKKKNVLRRQV